ncbi:MAG: MFS transporter [Novosphingobium sp.]
MAKTPRFAWYILFVLFLLWTVSFLDRQVIGLLIAPIRSDLGLSDFDISLLQGFSFALCYGIAGIPIGWLVDNVSRRWVIFVGITIWGLAAMGSGFASNFEMLFLARMVVGVGEAALSPAGYSILADVFPKRRLSMAISIAAMGGALGSGLAFTLSGVILELTGNGTLEVPLIGHLAPWKQVFILTGLPGLFIGLLIFTFPEPGRHKEDATIEPTAQKVENIDKSWGAFFSYIRSNIHFFGSHIVGFTMFSIANYGFLAWAAEYMRREFAWSAVKIGATFGPAHTFAVFAAFTLGGFVVDRMFGKGMKDAHLRIFSLFALICVPLVAWTMLTSNPWVFLIVSTIWGLFTISFGGAAAAALQITTPAQFRGRISSLYLVIVVLCGMTIGPSAIAALTDFFFADEQRLGSSILIVLLTVYPVGALALWLGTRPMQEIVDRVEGNVPAT